MFLGSLFGNWDGILVLNLGTEQFPSWAQSLLCQRFFVPAKVFLQIWLSGDVSSKCRLLHKALSGLTLIITLGSLSCYKVSEQKKTVETAMRSICCVWRGQLFCYWLEGNSRICFSLDNVVNFLVADIPICQSRFSTSRNHSGKAVVSPFILFKTNSFYRKDYWKWKNIWWEQTHNNPTYWNKQIQIHLLLQESCPQD